MPNYSSEYPVSIVPFPYGSNVRLAQEGQAETYLTIMSAMAIDAAVQLQKHMDGEIIIPGETPFEDLDSTTQLMTQRAKEQGVDPTSIVKLSALRDGRRLNNTYLQAEGIAENLPHNRNLIVVALEYHMLRVQGAIKAFNITADFKSVESVLQENNILTYDSYFPAIAKLRKSEIMARIITNGLLLPKGQIPNLMVQMCGARVVDVHHTDNGKLEIENDLVRRKRKKLEINTTQN